MGLDGVEPVFSALGEERLAHGLELVYAGYVAHYGRVRHADDDAGLLAGDDLYARGLAEIAALGEPEAVTDLAELLARCAELRGRNEPGDGELWAASAALLGRGPLRAGADPGRLARDAAGERAVARALAAHAERIG
jgi:hypothetical protein